nr:hypothetical protein Iba_chr04eCG1970 [Ipomoea batatas]
MTLLLLDGSCSSFSLMYFHILFTTSPRDSAFSPVPKNFTRESESWSGARKPVPPPFSPFCRFTSCFGSKSESESSSLPFFRCLSFGGDLTGVTACFGQSHICFESV